jgi:hypothetical protein
MTVRWEDLPPGAKVAEPRARRKAAKGGGHLVPGRFVCAGPDGCGHVTEGAYGTAERHADECGAHRIDVVLPEVDE